jgi:hypothetical protein
MNHNPPKAEVTGSNPVGRARNARAREGHLRPPFGRPYSPMRPQRGQDVVEGYFADHAGHKGVKAARSQSDAWLDIIARADWRNPEDVKASYPKTSILKAGRVVFNVKGNDYDWLPAFSIRQASW